MCVTLLEGTPSADVFSGSTGRNRTQADTVLSLLCSGCEGRRGRGQVSCSRVQVIRGQRQHMRRAEIQALLQSQGELPGGPGPANSLARLHHHGVQGARLGVHTRPGVCRRGHTPSTVACRTLPLLVPDRFWKRFPAQLLFHPLSGLAHSCGINIKEDYSRQLQV